MFLRGGTGAGLHGRCTSKKVKGGCGGDDSRPLRETVLKSLEIGENFVYGRGEGSGKDLIGRRIRYCLIRWFGGKW